MQTTVNVVCYTTKTFSNVNHNKLIQLKIKEIHLEFKIFSKLSNTLKTNMISK